ncbi:NAD(P)/FAD-dependent oxidoreductase [Georgenia sp. AZ-5]|uniref:NAD(P)/FAD-dependent oxidoreductase n=1 Tax=Georgenia sp. AZ-5 TaxID=3367526 RepID=UPI0037546B14
MSGTSIGRIVIVGAGLSAARAAAALRRKGFTGDLVMVGAEPHLPYDRPPLSKEVLRGTRESTALPFDPGKLWVQVRVATTATGLDLDSRLVRTSAGEEPFDGLVIATGAAPVRLPGDGEQLVLRTLEDALALRGRLAPGARVVIIGASWIGAEVATAALEAGCRVTCLEAGTAPVAQALGEEVGRLFLPWWSGVDLRLGTAVREVAPGEVCLADGGTVPADVVVTGVGVRPAIGWLAGSGLALGRGVRVDEHLRASAPGVVAVGDVAQRYSPRAGEHILVEHWDDAGTAPAVAAAALLAGADDELAVHDPVPYFWSDQFEHKIQYVGRHGALDRVEIDREDAQGFPVVRWFDNDGVLTAWLGVDRARELVKARTAVRTRPTPAEAGLPVQR